MATRNGATYLGAPIGASTSSPRILDARAGRARVTVRPVLIGLHHVYERAA